jgi:hypothetical protein
MTLTHPVVFNVTLLAAIASPGASLLFLTRMAMAQGRRAVLAAAAGLGSRRWRCFFPPRRSAPAIFPKIQPSTASPPPFSALSACGWCSTDKDHMP